MPKSKEALSHLIRQSAFQQGFHLAGICPAVTPAGFSEFCQWLEAGYAGEMHYLGGRREAYRHPESVLKGVRSIVMLAINYRTAESSLPQSGHGRVSRYAWGTDYHDVIHEKLKAMAGLLVGEIPDASVRGIVDTAPLLEREFAQMAGLGWIGKNTLLLNRDIGSWFFLAALLTDVELQYDEQVETNHCGTCTACLDACPTDAFVAPYKLDSRKCI
ncbi:MAG: tRNA epoxyqueuosine(34) reductase QueG, partial [Planctomycetales bacterium]